MEGGETSPCNDCVAHDPTTGPRCWCHDRTLCQRRPKMDPLATGAIGGQGSPGVDTSTVQRDFRLGICAATHSQHAGPRKDGASPCRVEGGYARPLMPRSALVPMNAPLALVCVGLARRVCCGPPAAAREVVTFGRTRRRRRCHCVAVRTCGSALRRSGFTPDLLGSCAACAVQVCAN